MYYSKNIYYETIRPRSNLCLLLVSTGIKRSTNALVSSVKKFRDSKKDLFNDICSSAYDICVRGKSAVHLGDERLIGELMNENHRLLQNIGVSHEKIDEIFKICLRKGALGAKLTGAGGGGSLIALIPKKDRMRLISDISKEVGYQCRPIKFDMKGLLTN